MGRIIQGKREKTGTRQEKRSEKRNRACRRSVNTMDTKLKTDIIILIIGVLIGASGYLANSLILYNTSVNKDRSDIAEGLYFDISSLEDYLISTDREFLANPGNTNIYIQGVPFYPENGLYFNYQRDIPRLDRKIAQDTFTFYNHLLAAERDRSNIYEIQRRGDVRELTKVELRRQQILTQDAAREVNVTVNLLLPLRQELAAAT
jgi:hypothetical protein